jgi:hypothetical protein
VPHAGEMSVSGRAISGAHLTGELLKPTGLRPGIRRTTLADQADHQSLARLGNSTRHMRESAGQSRERYAVRTDGLRKTTEAGVCRSPSARREKPATILRQQRSQQPRSRHCVRGR